MDGDLRQPIASSLDLSRVQVRTDLEADILDRLDDCDSAAKRNLAARQPSNILHAQLTMSARRFLR